MDHGQVSCSFSSQGVNIVNGDGYKKGYVNKVERILTVSESNSNFLDYKIELDKFTIKTLSMSLEGGSKTINVERLNSTIELSDSTSSSGHFAFSEANSVVGLHG